MNMQYQLITSENLEWITVATTADLPNGTRRILEIDGQPVAVFNIAGTYYAIADVCSHDDGPVAEGDLDGYEIECPRHGARFDVRSGKVLTFPAIVDIPAYETRVEAGEVQIAFPVEAE
jgi:3-phenylpropionate/trans-cinnamate dioxygenase ferredoxin component